jgi:hypothetical protein
VQASFPPAAKTRNGKAHVSTLQTAVVTCNPQATLILGVEKKIKKAKWLLETFVQKMILLYS